MANEGVAGHSTEPGAGNVLMTGPTLSVTLMIWDAVELLPQSSVAVQVLVILYSCGQDPPVVTSTKVKVTVASQASVAVGMSKEGTAGHSTELIPGRELMTGAVLSVTVMIWDAVEVLPQLSVAVQVLVLTNSCGHDPLVVASVNVSATLASQASVAVAVAKDGVAGHSIELGAGTPMIVGPVMSCVMVIVNGTEALSQVGSALLRILIVAL